MGGLDDLAQENPEVSNALIQAYLFWIKDVGFDAVRVDAASSIYKNFLSDFEKALGVATFGEVFNGNVDFVSDFQKYEWGVLDFPLFFAARDVFAKDVGFRAARRDPAIFPACSAAVRPAQAAAAHGNTRASGIRASFAATSGAARSSADRGPG